MQALFLLNSIFSSFFHALIVFKGKRKYLKLIYSWVLNILLKNFFAEGEVKTILVGFEGLYSYDEES
jgi:hypothetical protein